MASDLDQSRQLGGEVGSASADGASSHPVHLQDLVAVVVDDLDRDPAEILGRFASTHDAWPAVITAVEAGRTPRMLVLDWHRADGSRGPVASGVTLEYLARSGLGLPAEHLRSPDQRGR